MYLTVHYNFLFKAQITQITLLLYVIIIHKTVESM